MILTRLKEPLTVCKVSMMEEALTGGRFLFIGRTDREISVVCETAHVPAATVERNDGWRGFRIEGQLDFSLIGILAGISKVLAAASIGLFVVSTFDTDYILVKAKDFEGAARALVDAGYEVGD